MITGIVVALATEINSITQKKIKLGGLVQINANTLLAFSGMGVKNAAIASQELINHGSTRLISWGCASALNPSLRPGDLVIPQTIITATQERLTLSTPWLNHVVKMLAKFNPNTGVLVESNVIITTSLAKKALYKQHKAIALDMESGSIAQIARKNKIPMLAIRSIVDSANINLPKAINYSLNEQGDFRLLKLFEFLLTHPAELPELIKLACNFSAAKNKLKSVSRCLHTIVNFKPNISI